MLNWTLFSDYGDLPLDFDELRIGLYIVSDWIQSNDKNEICFGIIFSSVFVLCVWICITKVASNKKSSIQNKESSNLQ